MKYSDCRAAQAGRASHLPCEGLIKGTLLPMPEERQSQSAGMTAPALHLPVVGDALLSAWALALPSTAPGLMPRMRYVPDSWDQVNTLSIKKGSADARTSVNQPRRVGCTAV